MTTYTAFRAGLTLEQAAALLNIEPLDVEGYIEEYGRIDGIYDQGVAWTVVEDGQWRASC